MNYCFYNAPLHRGTAAIPLLPSLIRKFLPSLPQLKWCSGCFFKDVALAAVAVPVFAPVAALITRECSADYPLPAPVKVNY